MVFSHDIEVFQDMQRLVVLRTLNKEKNLINLNYIILRCYNLLDRRRHWLHACTKIINLKLNFKINQTSEIKSNCTQNKKKCEMTKYVLASNSKPSSMVKIMACHLFTL